MKDIRDVRDVIIVFIFSFAIVSISFCGFKMVTFIILQYLIVLLSAAIIAFTLSSLFKEKAKTCKYVNNDYKKKRKTMYEFGVIICNDEVPDVDERMSRLCDYHGEHKADAFCDGWAPIYIDKEEKIHRWDDEKDGSKEVYFPALSSYKIRKMDNPYKTGDSFPVIPGVIVMPDGSVFDEEDGADIENIITNLCAEHPDWGALFIHFHR